jgi:hypothetical protein
MFLGPNRVVCLTRCCAGRVIPLALAAATTGGDGGVLNESEKVGTKTRGDRRIRRVGRYLVLLAVCGLNVERRLSLLL